VGSKNVAFVDLLTSARFAADARRSPFLRRVHAFDEVGGTGGLEVLRHRYDYVADLHTRGAPLAATTEVLISRLTGVHLAGYASDSAPAEYRLPPRGRDEHAVEYYARAFAGLIDAPLGDGRLHLSCQELATAAAGIPPATVCLAPGARFPWKRWPLESYAELASRLAAAGLSPMVVGHHSDAPHVQEVYRRCSGVAMPFVADTLTVAAVMAVSGVVVANNSGLNALAVAAGARVVCLHSHTLPAMWRPWGDHHVNLVGDPAEMPCKCSGAARHDLDVACGKSIPVTAVAEAVLRLRREHGKASWAHHGTSSRERRCV
jgi:ADP-heptose:LPS heptosyltransferase